MTPDDDGVVEGPETFNVTLTTTDDSVELLPDVATVIIQEDDSKWTGHCDNVIVFDTKLI